MTEEERGRELLVCVCVTFIIIDNNDVRHIVSKDTAPLVRRGQVEVESLTGFNNRVIIDCDWETQLIIGRGWVRELKGK